MPFPTSNIQFLDIIQRTYRLLEDVDGQDFITSAISATPSSGIISIQVNDVSQWPVQSRIEVDYELFLVATNPGGTGAGTITAYRTYESSYAAAHNANVISRRDPRFLKETVNEAINVVLNDWMSYYVPKTVWDLTTAGAYTPVRWIYNAPTDALAILRVTWNIPGFQKYVDVSHGQLQVFDTSICSTGLGFEVYETNGLPGYPVNVLYEKRWPILVNDTDVLDTAYPQEADDLLPLGAILYIAGVRQTPKWRLDEAVFYREQGAPLPPQFNMTWLKEAYDRWYQRARIVASKRPNQVPGKVFVGLTGM